MLLILSIVFFHSLIRFFMAIGRGSQFTGNHIPHNVGPSGYAQPERPIPVVLAGDEELLAESHRSAQEKIPPPPPAYGLWRSSVVSVSKCCSSFQPEAHCIPAENQSRSALLAACGGARALVQKVE